MMITWPGKRNELVSIIRTLLVTLTIQFHEMKNAKNILSPEQQSELLKRIKVRFEKHMNRHEGLSWETVKERLEAHPAKLWSLFEMENTEGEPDVVDFDKKSGVITFFDCAAESPKGRRSTCYDHDAWLARKEHRPEHNAIGMAEEMGIEMLTETQYRFLQGLGEFDTKTSSWLVTPAAIRKLGGAIFGDRRYDHVFTYHNGAQSYYAARGFRGCLKI